MREKKLKRQVCMTCKCVLEPVKTQWAARPVCYPCYWAAKFVYENGYKEFADIPVDFANMLREFFTERGYLWPDDLIKAFVERHFEKANTGSRRWWSFRCTEDHPCCESTMGSTRAH